MRRREQSQISFLFYLSRSLFKYNAAGLIASCLVAVSAFSGVVAAEMRVAAAPGQTDLAGLQLDGPISDDDVGSFVSLAARLSAQYRSITVVLNSPGGSVEAAMMIGRVIRARGFSTDVGRPYGSANRRICASACVLILAAGVLRTAEDDVVVIHRPTFPATDFAGLTREQASKTYQSLSKLVTDYLAEMGMSSTLYQAMLQVPSNSARRLSVEEQKAYGLYGSDPAFEEWQRAKLVREYGEAATRQWEEQVEKGLRFIHQCEASGRSLEECGTEAERRFPHRLGSSRK